MHSVKPALLCSLVDSAVNSLRTMALPANSGWARIRPICASRPASCRTCVMQCFRCAQEAKGRCAKARSAIQGECSYRPSSSCVASATVAVLSCVRVSVMVCRGVWLSSGAQHLICGRPTLGHGLGCGPKIFARP